MPCSPPGSIPSRWTRRGRRPSCARSAAGKSVITSGPIIADLEKGAARLTVTIHGNERRVRSLNLPQIGMSLVYDPLSKTEREMYAQAGQIDAVPVVTASK